MATITLPRIDLSNLDSIIKQLIHYVAEHAKLELMNDAKNEEIATLRKIVEEQGQTIERLQHVANDAAIGLIVDERKKQVAKLGFDAYHDDQHVDGELANAAAHYASTYDEIFYDLPASTQIEDGVERVFPFEPRWDQKKDDSRLDQLAKAGALVVAEMGRLLRLESKQLDK
jgi:hypothetical protein